MFYWNVIYDIILPTDVTQKVSYVYLLLQLVWVIVLFDINVVLMLPWWSDVTIAQADVTILVSWQLSTGSKHDYLFCYSPLVGILFEVLGIVNIKPSLQNILFLGGEGSMGKKNTDSVHFQHFSPFFLSFSWQIINLKNVDVYTFWKGEMLRKCIVCPPISYFIPV